MQSVNLHNYAMKFRSYDLLRDYCECVFVSETHTLLQKHALRVLPNVIYIAAILLFDNEAKGMGLNVPLTFGYRLSFHLSTEMSTLS